MTFGYAPCLTSSSATEPAESIFSRRTRTSGASKSSSTPSIRTPLIAEANGWASQVADTSDRAMSVTCASTYLSWPVCAWTYVISTFTPVTEILSQTPELPSGCQWVIFLHDHDELTLQQVSDEERDYHFSEYAKDPRMKRNMGIGRRLASLQDGDRQLAELLHVLALSLPGSPVIYYGDELLMGNNIYPGDQTL